MTRSGKWKKIINVDVKQALEYYKSQGTIPTLRTIYYRLYSLGVFPNTLSSYVKLSQQTARARENGILPINCFGDLSRNVIGNYDVELDFEEPEDYIDDHIEALKNINEYYQIPRWYNQSHHVEVWLEKQAMSPTVKSILQGKEVNIVPSKGYSSVTFLDVNATRLIRMLELGKKIHILYLGDYDPSGENIEDVTRNKLEQYGVYEVEFERIALTEDQITSFNLPVDPDSKTLHKLQNDPRANEFRANHDGQLYQVEVDALFAYAPQEFKDLILGPVDQYFDNEIYEQLLQKYSPERLHILVNERVRFLDEDEDEELNPE